MLKRLPVGKQFKHSFIVFSPCLFFSEDCFNINIPPGDPHFSETCMPLVRSLEAIATDCVPGKYVYHEYME